MDLTILIRRDRRDYLVGHHRGMRDWIPPAKGKRKEERALHYSLPLTVVARVRNRYGRLTLL